MSALEYERGRTEDMTTNSKETFSIFPEKTEETKDAYDKAEKKINNSVKLFANNLDKIKSWLTKELLDIFDNLKKDPKFKWLSNSDLWLHSLQKLYETNKIPSPLESILNEMMQLLNEYKILHIKSDKLYDMLKACAVMGNSHELNESWPKKWWDGSNIVFRPETHHQRWRWQNI